MTTPRSAELVLVTRDGRCIGSLPAVPVATPWWQDVEPVVQAVRQHHRVDVVIPGSCWLRSQRRGKP